jgi:hypothetical protein
MERVPLKSVVLTVVLASTFFAVGIAVGRLGHPSPTAETAVATPPPLFRLAFVPEGLLIQDNQQGQDDTPERDPNDPRELIPMPGPGGNEPQPGQGGQPQECGIYLYQDGQLYQLQPGQQLPGQGEGSPELIPLNPMPGGPGGSPGIPAAPPPPPGIES